MNVKNIVSGFKPSPSLSRGLADIARRMSEDDRSNLIDWIASLQIEIFQYASPAILEQFRRNWDDSLRVMFLGDLLPAPSRSPK